MPCSSVPLRRVLRASRRRMRWKHCFPHTRSAIRLSPMPMAGHLSTTLAHMVALRSSVCSWPGPRPCTRTWGRGSCCGPRAERKITLFDDGPYSAFQNPQSPRTGGGRRSWRSSIGPGTQSFRRRVALSSHARTPGLTQLRLGFFSAGHAQPGWEAASAPLTLALQPWTMASLPEPQALLVVLQGLLTRWARSWAAHPPTWRLKARRRVRTWLPWAPAATSLASRPWMGLAFWTCRRPTIMVSRRCSLLVLPVPQQPPVGSWKGGLIVTPWRAPRTMPCISLWRRGNAG
mmetsp:Transcript_60567/g.133105  ORF Transcript_60567/g.133105 Transcript_60567/m.133105 type:complete len:289 (-) Transcript_60567:400-1266(-)